jgi:ABC-type transport system involved in multi-copper enzyme maturation permease subunit
VSEPGASTAAPARARAAVGAGAAVRAIAGVTWTRLWRGRAVWIAAGIAALPYLLAAIGKAASRGGPHPAVGQAEVLSLAVLVMAVLPPLLVASAVAEELEDKTAAYLWSRPIARWTVLVGKLVVLLPLAAALVAGGTAAALRTLGPVDGGAGLTTISAALAAGASALGLCAAGISSLAPRQGTAVTIGYIILIDLPLGVLPAAIANLSITHHVDTLTGRDGVSAAPMIGLAALALAWGGLALWRIRTAE